MRNKANKTSNSNDSLESNKKPYQINNNKRRYQLLIVLGTARNPIII